MRALAYDRYGPPDVIYLTDRPKPEIGPGDVLVKVEASGVNTGDWRLRAAAFPAIMALPGRLMFGVFRPRNRYMGSEFAGQIISVGSQVKGFTLGDRVFGMSSTFGASADYLAMPETGAITKIPANLDFEEAAALPFGGICALVFLSDFAALKPGMRLLIVGASGGVGSYAVQIGKALGADVTGVSGPDSQEYIKALGVDDAIDYRLSPLDTWPGDFDIIFDTIGVLSPKQARHLLKERGIFAPLNFGLREIGAALTNPLRHKKIKLAINGDTQKDLKRLSNYVETGKVRPCIDSRFPLEKAQDAHRKVETRHRQGAIILTL